MGKRIIKGIIDYKSPHVRKMLKQGFLNQAQFALKTNDDKEYNEFVQCLYELKQYEEELDARA